MNESLLHLYELQKIDSKLDELHEGRGELPQRVAATKQSVENFTGELTGLRDHIHDIEHRLRDTNAESIDLREKVEKYKAQQFDVKTTREYDAITYQLEEGSKRLNQNLDSAGRMGIELEQSRNEERRMTEQLDGMTADLSEAETSLKDIMKETRGEEKQLMKDREELVPKIIQQHMNMYNRVRPAKNGIAVVPIRNGVCAGCYNAIPRQLVLELKKGDKHTVCEYCGRIVVGEPISLAVDGELVKIVYEVDAEE